MYSRLQCECVCYASNPILHRCSIIGWTEAYLGIGSTGAQSSDIWRAANVNDFFLQKKKLNSLATLNIEADLLSTFNCDDTIDTFAEEKILSFKYN